ncbi:hypothetical protein [Rhodococcus sp. B50]|uniref:hypothetical protein n=1 Tax=Rhodococcus sp. B50 TaxID=2682847 RepID=UPI0019E0EFFF|nr:hypothetical protein [Rhodococcus sp. B50]MBS9371062.1 hypothetical protein [Rhodococcus sp. B50]
MTRLPDEVRDEALAYVYAEFDRRKWEQVASSERGGVFDKLIADEQFSELLRPYYTPAQMRVWLKDSAAKEYPRALEGIGPTARYTRRGYPGPSVLVTATLGADWTVVPDSIEQKPMRCQAVSAAGDEAVVVWGSYRVLRDLYWAASGARVEGEGRVAVVITRPTMTALHDAEWARVRSFCALIGVEAFSVMYAPRALTEPRN